MKDAIPKKSMGQHWLYDELTLEGICESADVQSGDAVLEVGPGLGTLTRKLLTRKAKVTAVEFDKILASNLQARLLRSGSISPKLVDNLTVVESDILSFDLTTLPAGYKVVANIPYYLTSNLIRVLCESTNPFSQAVLLIQKEVAERVVAGQGKMSLLSVSTQYYCEVSLGDFVSAELFTPPPKVDSQVLVLKFRNEPLYADVDTKQFFRIVRAGFSQKRKTLLNSLSGGLAISKDEARGYLESAQIDPGARAQSLTIDQWHALYRAIH